MGSYTTVHNLYRPVRGETEWTNQVNANFDTLERSLIEGGEAFGANRVFGNTDAYSLGFMTNGINRLAIAAGGGIIMPISLNIGNTIPIVGFIDDDTMDAATATNLATSESIVAYITAQILLHDTFLELTDTPVGYTNANAIYTTNGTPNAVIETTIILTEAANTFNVTKGSASLDIAAGATLDVDANLTVEGVSVINQDLTTDAAGQLARLGLGKAPAATIPLDIILGATERVYIQATTADQTQVDGALDIDVDAAADDVMAMKIAIVSQGDYTNIFGFGLNVTSGGMTTAGDLTGGMVANLSDNASDVATTRIIGYVASSNVPAAGSVADWFGFAAHFDTGCSTADLNTTGDKAAFWASINDIGGTGDSFILDGNIENNTNAAGALGGIRLVLEPNVSGPTIQGININNVGSQSGTDGFILAGSFVDGIDLTGATTTNLINATNFTVSQAGVVTLASAGLVVGTSIPFSDAAGTLTLQNIDAVDATTIATIANAMGYNPNKVYTISPSGGDYTTIQAALTANNTGGELFLVYPGTYTNDTITFTANGQCVVGMGSTEQTIITSATTTIASVGAYTDCCIAHVTLSITGATSVVDVLNVSTGSACLIDVELSCTNSSVATANQPTCVRITGAGTVELIKYCKIDYNNAVAGATAIKAAVRIGAGSTFMTDRSVIDVDGSGASLATVPFYSATTGIYRVSRCDISVDDLNTTAAIGVYLLSSGISTLNYSDIHVTGGSGKLAYGVYTEGAVVVDAIANHIHVIASGGTAQSYYVDTGTTVNSNINSLIAADGTAGAGTLTFTHMPSNGNLAISGLTASAVVLTDANKQLTSVATLGIAYTDAKCVATWPDSYSADQNLLQASSVVFAGLTVTQDVATSGSPTAVTVTGGAHTTLAASTEATDISFNLGRTVQFATGALATQRAFEILAPTYAFVGASVLSDAATLYIDNEPQAGTNATLTRQYALWIDAGDIRLDDNLGIGLGTMALEGEIHMARGNANCQIFMDCFDNSTATNEINLRKSHNDTIGTLTDTINTEILGIINFTGVDNTQARDSGAQIYAIQNGAAGVTLPTDLIIKTWDNASGTSSFVCGTDGVFTAPALDIAASGRIAEMAENDQTGVSYTLVIGDAGKVVLMSNAGANVLTIPTNASVAFAVNTVIDVIMEGAGTTSVTAAGGVTLNGTAAGSCNIGNQYSAVTIIKRGADAWIVYGDHGGVT